MVLTRSLVVKFTEWRPLLLKRVLHTVKRYKLALISFVTSWKADVNPLQLDINLHDN